MNKPEEPYRGKVFIQDSPIVWNSTDHPKKKREIAPEWLDAKYEVSFIVFVPPKRWWMRPMCMVLEHVEYMSPVGPYCKRCGTKLW